MQSIFLCGVRFCFQIWQAGGEHGKLLFKSREDEKEEEQEVAESSAAAVEVGVDAAAWSVWTEPDNIS